MRTLNCPNCGANIDFADEEKEVCFCQYCGSKITMEDYRITNHIVDEARIKETETYLMIRNRELDMEEAALAEKKKKKLAAYIIALIFIAISVILFIASLFNYNEAAFVYRTFALASCLIAAFIAIKTFTDKL